MRQTLGPHPQDAPPLESIDVTQAAMQKLSAFYLAKTNGPNDPDRSLANHRYYPLGFGMPDEDGVYRWGVWDNLEDRFLSSTEVLDTPIERLMDARLAH